MGVKLFLFFFVLLLLLVDKLLFELREDCECFFFNFLWKFFWFFFFKVLKGFSRESFLGCLIFNLVYSFWMVWKIGLEKFSEILINCKFGNWMWIFLWVGVNWSMVLFWILIVFKVIWGFRSYCCFWGYYKLWLD